ncbi:hypothetical protein ILYODFUR_020691 [Ilyodon furcidens]|uniref:Nucleolar protein 4 n=1 Tax=Ilyodon furcidens TaxID=33524 RepID=A0ABV0SZ57_9TELE
MTTRKPAGVVGDMVPISKLQTQTQQSSRGPVGGDRVPAEAAEMVGEFRDWCLKTYGDSGKTKTVTRRKYNKILQTLLQEGEEDGGAALLQEKEAGSHHINAKFKFWVRSKGFQVDRSGPSSSDGPVLYVPIKATNIRLLLMFFRQRGLLCCPSCPKILACPSREGALTPRCCQE